MGKLFDQIRASVAADRWVVSNHADDRLRERGILAWQVIDGLGEGRLLSERPMDRPNPSIEVSQTLADGTPVMVVWAFISGQGVAVLVTVHFFDR